MQYELNGEIFEIKEIKNTISPNRGKFKTSYGTEKNSRTGTLIIETTIEKVKKELDKASRRRKIYSRG